MKYNNLLQPYEQNKNFKTIALDKKRPYFCLPLPSRTSLMIIPTFEPNKTSGTLTTYNHGHKSLKIKCTEYTQ